MRNTTEETRLSDPALTPDEDGRAELARRLVLAAAKPKLMGELYAIMKSEIDREEERKSSIESRATSLLTMSVFSVAVLFALAFGLMRSTEFLVWIKANSRWSLVAMVLFTCAASSVLLSAFLAMCGLMLKRSYRWLDPEAVFNVNELKLEFDQQEGGPDPDTAALTDYKRFLMPQLFAIVAHHYNLNEKKATIVKTGQSLYIAFLSSMLIFAIVVGIATGICST